MPESEVFLAPLQESKLGSALERIIQSLQLSDITSSSSPQDLLPRHKDTRFVDQSSRIAEKSVLFQQLIRSLKLKHGYECSFKLSHHQLLCDRFLIGIEKRDITVTQIQDLCLQMQMPADYQQNFLSQLAEANVLGFGFEATANRCFYKAYLEFWDQIQAKLCSQPRQLAPLSLFLGYKWNALDPTQAVLSTYLYYPSLSVAEILLRISRIYGSQNSFVCEWVNSIIQLAASRFKQGSFVYVEVSEGNSRQSFDINIYRADLKIHHIQAQLQKLCQHYAISTEAFAQFCASIADRPLGHLSGGYDRTGQDFVTLYYEIEALS
jgi:hypothetical protein